MKKSGGEREFSNNLTNGNRTHEKADKKKRRRNRKTFSLGAQLTAGGGGENREPTRKGGQPSKREIEYEHAVLKIRV